MFTSFKRITTFALEDFSRNKGISIATIFVLVVTIMVVTGLFFFQGMASFLTLQIQDKIDITAYFQEDVTEEEILQIKDEVSKMSSNIKDIKYVSKEQALEIFNQRYSGNPIFEKALQEVGSNPLLPSLNITTTNGEPVQYQEISELLKNASFAKSIDHVDFIQRKDTIEKVYSLIKKTNTFGLVSGIILIFVAILVVFNTIKLAIEKSKEEITTMRLVGASDGFIRGPFIIQGIIYGVIAFLICFVLTWLASFFSASEVATALPGFDTLSYFLTNWWIFVLIQLGFGIGVGVVSSLIVIRKYLDI